MTDNPTDSDIVRAFHVLAHQCAWCGDTLAPEGAAFYWVTAARARMPLCYLCRVEPTPKRIDCEKRWGAGDWQVSDRELRDAAQWPDGAA